MNTLSYDYTQNTLGFNLPFAAAEQSKISISELVSALSFALDLTHSSRPGHAVRACIIGMQIADVLDLSEPERSALYYALLLKDIGCSSNAERMYQIIGGDDIKVKEQVKLLDWTRPSLDGIKMLWSNVLPGASTPARLKRMLKVALEQPRNNEQMIGLRCERGAQIVAKIGMAPETGEDIRRLDEHWNGCGFPGHLKGDRIPLGARIISVAQSLDAFYSELGGDGAIAKLKERSGRWFDPKLVRIAESLHRGKRLWQSRSLEEDRKRVIALAPQQSGNATLIQIDSICEAFADVVDAKSSFTYSHSLGVTRAAGLISQKLGLAADRQTMVYRAALLHDLGKLGVPNTVLDKPGKLDHQEWLKVKMHPALTQQILERIGQFREMAEIAGQHHERLDGSGYPNGLSGEQLSLESRLIAVADVYGALSEDRPYRPALSLQQIVSIMGREVPGKLDPMCFEALISALQETETPVAVNSTLVEEPQPQFCLALSDAS